MSGQVSVENDLCDAIGELIVKEQYDDAFKEIRKVEHRQFIVDNVLDLIPNWMTLTQEDFFNSHAESCLEDIFYYVVSVSSWKESLIAFLSHLEHCNSDSIFRICISSFRQIRTKAPFYGQKSDSFRTICELIIEYLKSIDLSIHFDLDCHPAVIDNDKNIDRMSRLFYPVSDLHNEMYSSILTAKECWTDVIHSKLFYLKHIFELFEVPLLYMFVEKERYAHTPTCRLMKIVATLSPDLILIFRHMVVARKEVDDPKNSISYSCNAVGSYLYCLFYTKMEIDSMPCVYSNEFIYRQSFLSLSSMLDVKHHIVQQKSFYLTETFLSRIADSSLESDLLEIPTLLDIYNKIVRELIFSSEKLLRTHALRVYKMHLKKWTISGRFKLLRILLTRFEHSGFRSLLIQDFKSELLALGKPLPVEDMNIVLNILRKSLYLPKREESDFLELYDSVMATMNLIIWLCSQNDWRLSLILPDLENLENNFLQPLVKGIDISVAHYKERLKQSPTTSMQINRSVSVDGKSVPPMTPQQETETIHLALNYFQMMSISYGQVSNVVQTLKSTRKLKCDCSLPVASILDCL